MTSHQIFVSLQFVYDQARGLLQLAVDLSSELLERRFPDLLCIFEQGPACTCRVELPSRRSGVGRPHYVRRDRRALTAWPLPGSKSAGVRCGTSDLPPCEGTDPRPRWDLEKFP